MYDSHIHTAFSADSKASLVDVIESAIHKKLKTITITDHIDYKHTQDIHFEFEPRMYGQAIAGVQKVYKDKIEIRKGVELGIKPGIIDMCKALIKKESFDFVIASMHSCLGEDFYFGNFFDDKTPEEAMGIYLEEMYKLIHVFTDFDVLGHIDLPKRYNEPISQMDLTCVLPSYEKIFKRLIALGKGIEINTSGLRQEVGIQFPDQRLLKLYYDCGGRILTIGSDAHMPDDLGKGFSHVFNILESIGFEHICTFENRQVRFHNLANADLSLKSNNG